MTVYLNQTTTFQGDPIIQVVIPNVTTLAEVQRELSALGPTSLEDVTPSPFPGPDTMEYYAKCFNHTTDAWITLPIHYGIAQSTNTVASTKITGQGFFVKRTGTPTPDNKLFYGIATSTQATNNPFDHTKWTASTWVGNANIPLNGTAWISYYFLVGSEKSIDNCVCVIYSETTGGTNIYSVAAASSTCYTGGFAAQNTGTGWKDLGLDTNFYLLKYKPGPMGDVTSATANPSTLPVGGGTTQVTVNVKNVGGQSGTFRICTISTSGEKTGNSFTLSAGATTSNTHPHQITQSQNITCIIECFINNAWYDHDVDYVYVTVSLPSGPLGDVTAVTANPSTLPPEGGITSICTTVKNVGDQSGTFRICIYTVEGDIILAPFTLAANSTITRCQPRTIYESQYVISSVERQSGSNWIEDDSKDVYVTVPIGNCILLFSYNGNGHATCNVPKCLPQNLGCDCGTVVTVTAIPDSGCTFSHWSGAVSSEENPLTFTLNTDMVVIANFISGGGTSVIGGFNFSNSIFYDVFLIGEQNAAIATIELTNTGDLTGIVNTKYFYRTFSDSIWTELTGIFQVIITDGDSILKTHFANIPNFTGEFIFGVKVWGETENEPSLPIPLRLRGKYYG